MNQSIFDTICAEIASGRSMRSICQDDGMPDITTVFRWLAKPEQETARQQYTHARETQADAMLEEILEIADDGKQDTVYDEDGKERVIQDVIARSRLRVDARKWAMSKMAPKKYGDKLDVGVDGTVNVNIVRLADR